MAKFSVSVTVVIDTDSRDPKVFPEYSDLELMDDTVKHLVKKADEFLGHGGDVIDSSSSVRIWKESDSEVH